MCSVYGVVVKVIQGVVENIAYCWLLVVYKGVYTIVSVNGAMQGIVMNHSCRSGGFCEQVVVLPRSMLACPKIQM